MAGLGDRAVAGLLSALAEAPDFPAAASFFLAQLADITHAPRGCMLRLDSRQDALVLVTSFGFDATPAAITVPISDLSSPLVISALTLSPIRGATPLPQRSLAPLVP